MNLREKMEVARQLARLNVDVIEAGFPVISDGDFHAVQQIATEIRGPIIAGLARCVPGDIDAAGAAVKPAGDRGRIHVFLATSKLHREHKLRKAQDEILRLATEGVKRAKGPDARCRVFSPEDASRTEPEFLAQTVQAAIEAGATTINIPDTVGFAVPDQFARIDPLPLRQRAQHPRRRRERALPQRSGPRRREFAGRRPRRRPAGGRHDQRHRRARGQRGAGRSRHGAADAARRCSATSPPA